MTINVWRYSHFLLAVFSFIFLIIASLTGVILASKPIIEQNQSYIFKNELNNTTVAELLPNLFENYEEVFSLEVDENKALILNSFEGEVYIHPKTAEEITEVQQENEFYSWVKSLHRSLFLHKTGRIIMGIVSFLLFLITISGSILIIQRVGGLFKFFKPITKHGSAQYYHTITGRIMLLPILILALTGAHLVLVELNFIQEQPPTTENFAVVKSQRIEPQEFEIFKHTYLSELQQIEFPFSKDEEDVFLLKLKNKTLKIHQYTGQILSIKQVSFSNELIVTSKNLHTGRSNWLWAILLGLASMNILYFIYSGAVISWKRISSKTKNKYLVKDAEIIILFGSENGHTQKLAALIYQKLLARGYKVYINSLNNYQLFNSANKMLLLTSTYGEGEAPANATLFLEKLNKIAQPTKIETTIIGFGSHAYENFCSFSTEIQQSVNENEFLKKQLPLTKIHNQNYIAFKIAVENWAKKNELKFQLPKRLSKDSLKRNEFMVVNRMEVFDGFSTTFVLELASEYTNFQSGDLLAIQPNEYEEERYYSIAKNNKGNIVLSIKLHKLGICSNYLYRLKKGEKLIAHIQHNLDFHQPNKKPIIFIANGTGIAPFLGMMNNYDKQTKFLYYGDRTKQNLGMYEKYLSGIENTSAFSVQFAFSRESETPNYVQDLIKCDAERIIYLIVKKNATIMICGSIIMQKGVLETLNNLLKPHKLTTQKLIAKGKILMDCY